MVDINCHIPIKLRLVGHLNTDQLERLAERMTQSVSKRMAAAEAAIASRHPELKVGGEVELRESFNPAREDQPTGTYAIPSYQNKGQLAHFPVRQNLRSRPWFIRKAINFHALVGEFLDFLEDLDPARPLAEAEVYIDISDKLRSVSLWLVQVNRTYLLDEFRDILFQRAMELSRVRGNQVMAYGLGTYEDMRQQLITIDQDNIVSGEIPEISGNERFLETVPRNLGEQLTGRGEIRLKPGAWVLFASMVLPKIELIQVAREGTEIVVVMHLRDLSFLVRPPLFEYRHHVSWKAYTQEFGDDPAIVHILPFTVSKPIHVSALEYLAEQRVSQLLNNDGLLGPDTVWYGNLSVLNYSRLQEMPSAIRQQADSLSNDVTRLLDENQVWKLQPGWKTAYLSTVLTIDDEHLHAARYRPEARRLAVELISKLQGHPDEEWGWNMLHFLQSHYGDVNREDREPGGPPFEYLLAELERRGWFEQLYEKVEASGRWDVLQLLIRHSLTTRYATHARIQRALDEMNSRWSKALRHAYKVREQEIWLDHKSKNSVRVGSRVYDANTSYSIKRETHRIKEARLPAFRAAMEAQAQALFGQIIRGEETQQYDEESFTKEVLGRAVKRINLGEDDIETVTIERTVRLVGIERRIVDAVTRYYITYEFDERVNGGPWQPVPDSRITNQSELEFEQMLWNWSFRKSSAIVEGFAIGVSVIGIIVIAWEAGVITLLIEAAGGTTTVLVSITLAELIYIGRIIFGDARWSLREFLTTALDGYLMALAFRGAGILGRGLAGHIGTAPIRQLIGGWILERITVGVIGGAGSAALTTFCHGMIQVVSGEGGWPKLHTYITKMARGAALGVVFEFGVGALQPILRAGGETGLETLGQVVTRVREAGISPARWTALSAEALSNMRQRFGEVISAARAGDLARWFGERLNQVTEGLGEAYRLAVFRRVLELSPEALTRPAVEGLEKFLSLSRADLTNEVALNILNRLNPTQLRSFLEALNGLDDPLISALSRARQLEGLSGVPQVIHAIGADPALANLVRLTAGLPGEAAAARLGGLVRVATGLPHVPETVARGEFFARGGTSQVYEVAGRPDLLVKLGGGRLPAEAQGLIELEMLGIETVYAGTRRAGGQIHIVLQKVEGVSSKDIIGRTRQPLSTPQYTEVVTQRTIDDLERVYQTLQNNRANIGDFQFIVRRSDGAVFVNDPVSVTVGRSGPSGNIRNIIDRFRRILRNRQSGTP